MYFPALPLGDADTSMGNNARRMHGSHAQLRTWISRSTASAGLDRRQVRGLALPFLQLLARFLLSLSLSSFHYNTFDFPHTGAAVRVTYDNANV